jgi:hypothetical protein
LQDKHHDDASPPTANTCLQHQTRKIMQDFIHHLAESPLLPQPFVNQQATAHRYPPWFLSGFAQAVLDDETGDLLEYRHLLKHPKYKDVWSKSFGKEIWRLATTTETIAFKSKQKIPTTCRKDITYGRIVCTYHPEKQDPHRTCITMGGNLINYLDDCGTPTADLLTVKLLFNSIISTPHAKFMTIDIKDFYLNTCFPLTLSKSMASKTKWTRTETCSVRRDVECMVSHKRASLPKNYSQSA